LDGVAGDGGAKGAPNEWAGEGENVKKLFGVMILASFPVACGSLPSGPDAVSTNPAADDAMASSLAKGRRPAPLPTPQCKPSSIWIDDIQISVIERGPGYATLRAEPVVYNSDPAVPCFVPTWSVDASDVALTVEKDPQVAILTGPAGRYVVYAAFSGPKGEIVGSASVSIR
jgi:hypothetical protein